MYGIVTFWSGSRMTWEQFQLDDGAKIDEWAHRKFLLNTSAREPASREPQAAPGSPPSEGGGVFREPTAIERVTLGV